MSKCFIRAYILSSLVVAIMIAGTLSLLYIRTIFNTHTRFDPQIIEQLYFDSAIFDIDSLLNFKNKNQHTDAYKRQNEFLKNHVAKHENYNYFIYDNYTGRLESETMLHAGEFLWLGTYSMLMSDDLVSSIYLITNDNKIIGLVEQQSSVPVKLDTTDRDFKKSQFWKKFFNCGEPSCNYKPYVTNLYIDKLTNDDIITVMLPYRLNNNQFGVVGLDVRTKVLFEEFFDTEGIVTPTNYKLTDVDKACSKHHFCLSKEIALIDSQAFYLSWEYDLVDLMKSIISTERFIYSFLTVLFLMGCLYNLINMFILHHNRDALTKTHTRQVVLNPRVYKQFSYVLMIDIDNFKAINDGYGHDVGDKVLIAFANHLKKHTRKDDVICRWGGEEFIVLYRTGVDENNMLDIVRRLWSSPVTILGSSLNVTFSGGLVRMDRDISSSVNAADRLLYHVKRNGKNNVMLEANGEHSLLL